MREFNYHNHLNNSFFWSLKKNDYNNKKNNPSSIYKVDRKIRKNKPLKILIIDRLTVKRKDFFLPEKFCITKKTSLAKKILGLCNTLTMEINFK